MKHLIDDNGIIREMTPEEVAEMERMAAEMPPPPPDPIEELKRTQLEQDAALMELAAMLTGGV